MNLERFIAKMGDSPTFVAFMAHCWFAFALVTTFGFWAIPPALGVAIVKELWFDVRFEANQTQLDGVKDLAGYVSGLGLGALLVWWRL